MPFQAGKYKFARQRRAPDGSTCVQALRFEIEDEELIVHFVKGQVYSYDSLPQEVYQEFKDSSSRGEYFNANIRNNYSYSRIS